MVGDDEELLLLAEKLVETYDLYELLEFNDVSHVALVYYLLQRGYISEDLPHVV